MTTFRTDRLDVLAGATAGDLVRLSGSGHAAAPGAGGAIGAVPGNADVEDWFVSRTRRGWPYGDYDCFSGGACGPRSRAAAIRGGAPRTPPAPGPGPLAPDEDAERGPRYASITPAAHDPAYTPLPHAAAASAAQPTAAAAQPTAAAPGRQTNVGPGARCALRQQYPWGSGDPMVPTRPSDYPPAPPSGDAARVPFGPSDVTHFRTGMGASRPGRTAAMGPRGGRGRMSAAERRMLPPAAFLFPQTRSWPVARVLRTPQGLKAVPSIHHARAARARASALYRAGRMNRDVLRYIWTETARRFPGLPPPGAARRGGSTPPLRGDRAEGAACGLGGCR